MLAMMSWCQPSLPLSCLLIAEETVRPRVSTGVGRMLHHLQSSNPVVVFLCLQKCNILRLLGVTNMD